MEPYFGNIGCSCWKLQNLDMLVNFNDSILWFLWLFLVICCLNLLALSRKAILIIVWYSSHLMIISSEVITLEAVTWTCFVKKLFWKFFAKFTGRQLCQSLFFINVSSLLQRCFPVNFANFLRTCFIEHLRLIFLSLLFIKCD